MATPRFQPLDMNALIKQYGFVEGVRRIQDRVARWPDDPRHPNYQQEKQLAIAAASAAANLSAASSDLLIEGAKKLRGSGLLLGLITVLMAASDAGAMEDAAEAMRVREMELRGYIAVQPGISRLKATIRILLDQAIEGYKRYDQYRDSLVAKMIGLAEGVIDAAQATMNLATAVLNAVADIVKALAGSFGWLKWVALGLGGIWAYDKLWGKKSTS